MRRLPLIVLIVLLTGPALANAQQQHIYQWTDAQGITHYSDSPPPRGTKYSEMDEDAMPAAASSAASASQEVTAADPAPPSAEKAPRIDDTPANRKKLCNQLSNNMKLLGGDSALTVDGAKGKQQSLSEDRRTEELTNTQQQYDQYCK